MIKTFPLNSKKRPAVPKDTDWREWVGEAKTDIVGVMIPKDVYIIDVDTYKGVSTDDVDQIIGFTLDWESAALQSTLSGGMHYAFRVDPSDDLLNKANVFVDYGIKHVDTRASGKGYIATGKGYEDLTLFGLFETLANADMLPVLPAEALPFFKADRDTDGLGFDADDDLMLELAHTPLDLSDNEVRAYVEQLTSEQAADSDTWLKAMFAIYHQTNGSDFGWELFDAFSRKALDKYDERENKSRWASAGKSKKAKPVTFASVISMVGHMGREVVTISEGGTFDTLMEEAKTIEDLTQYTNLKAKVSKLKEHELGLDLRAMISAEVFKAYGKEYGLSKTDIKKALQPIKKRRKADDGSDAPEWLEPWVYVENKCEFHNIELNCSIKREAFNAKYDRMPQPQENEMSAGQYALLKRPIKTVFDTMFWPNAGQMFEYNGLKMINDYREQGCAVADGIDADGQKAVDTLLRHVAMTLADEREQTILLDWITHIYRNPGKRVNWSPLLQGAQGIGKTYFVELLQMLLGDNVRNLDPTAIAGRFTGWAHGALVVAVEEVRVSGTNRYEVLDRMKPFITNNTIQIEEKGRDHRTVPNFTSYFMLTNHKDAIPLTTGDRRYCVFFSRIQSEQQLLKELGGKDSAEDYFNELFNSLADNADALARFFADRPISKHFNARGRAPDTSAREKMMSLSMSPERAMIEDAISENECGCINDKVIDLTQLNNFIALMGVGEMPKTRAMTAILSELGYSQIAGRRKKIDGEYRYLWFKEGDIDEKDAIDMVVKYHTGEDEWTPF